MLKKLLNLLGGVFNKLCIYFTYSSTKTVVLQNVIHYTLYKTVVLYNVFRTCIYFCYFIGFFVSLKLKKIEKN